MNSDFLYSRPSFLEGLARLMDFGNTLNQYNVSSDPKKADSIAIWKDWSMVGQDFRYAIADFEEDEADALNSSDSND